MQLTKDSNCSDPAWSPDGKKIAFTRKQRRETGLGDGRRRAKPDTVNSCGTELSPGLVAPMEEELPSHRVGSEAE